MLQKLQGETDACASCATDLAHGITTAQLRIENFPLLGFAMQFGKNTDFRPEQFGNNWNRKIVDSSPLISLRSICIGKVNGGYKYNCGSLKARVLARGDVSYSGFTVKIRK